jgi:hypothetical protein
VGYNIFSFFNQRFLIELFYNKYVTGVVLQLGGQTTKVLDKGSVEYLGPYGLEKGLLNISTNMAKLNTGVITSYALYIVVGLIFYMLFSSFFNNTIPILTTLLILSYTINISPNPYPSGNLLLQSKTFPCFNLRKFFLKLKQIRAIILSRAFLNHIFKKVFSTRSVLIVIFSVIISILVRFCLIKYGIDNPLLDYPVLYSSAAAISTFLCIPVKICIHTIFDIYADSNLTLTIGESNLEAINIKSQETYMMTRSTGEESTNSPSSASGNKSESINFDSIDDLLKKLRNQIQMAKDEDFKNATEDLSKSIKK